MATLVPATESRSEGDLVLKTLCNELTTIKNKLTELGIQLGISESKVKELLKEEDPLSAIVGYWLKGNTDIPVSWQSIVTTLRSSHVGERGLADKIQDKYCKPKVDSNHPQVTGDALDEQSSISKDKEEDIQLILEENLDDIITEYGIYVDQLCAKIEEANVRPEQLCTYLTTLSAYGEAHDGSSLALLCEKKDELEKCNTIQKIFRFLTTECASFLNYGIFCKIRKRYKIQADEEEEYKSHLTAFLNKHDSSNFEIINPKISLVSKSEKLNLKFNIKHTCKLAKVDNLKLAVARIMKVHPSALHLINIKKGCLCVTYLIPVSLAKEIFVSNDIFSPQQKDKFQELSVLWLECNQFKYAFVGEEKDSSLQEQEEVEVAATEETEHTITTIGEEVAKKNSLKPSRQYSPCASSHTSESSIVLEDDHITTTANTKTANEATKPTTEIQSVDEDLSPDEDFTLPQKESPNFRRGMDRIKPAQRHFSHQFASCAPAIHEYQKKAYHDSFSKQDSNEKELEECKEPEGSQSQSTKTVSPVTATPPSTTAKPTASTNPVQEQGYGQPSSYTKHDVDSPTCVESKKSRVKLLIPAEEESEKEKMLREGSYKGLKNVAGCVSEEEAPEVGPEEDAPLQMLAECENALSSTQDETENCRTALTPEYSFDILRSEFLASQSHWSEIRTYMEGTIDLETKVSLLTNVTQPSTQNPTNSAVILLTVENRNPKHKYVFTTDVTLYDEEAGLLVSEKRSPEKIIAENDKWDFVKFTVDIELQSFLEESTSMKLQLRVKVKVKEYIEKEEMTKLPEATNFLDSPSETKHVPSLTSIASLEENISSPAAHPRTYKSNEVSALLSKEKLLWNVKKGYTWDKKLDILIHDKKEGFVKVFLIPGVTDDGNVEKAMLLVMSEIKSFQQLYKVNELCRIKVETEILDTKMGQSIGSSEFKYHAVSMEDGKVSFFQDLVFRDKVRQCKNNQLKITLRAITTISQQKRPSVTSSAV